jgi:hypothetical protein
MNSKDRAVRAQLLTCAVLLGLLAWTGLAAQENVTLNQRAPTARLTAIGDDPDPILWNRYQLQVRLSSRVVDAIIAITSFAGPGLPGVPIGGSLFLLEWTTTTVGETASVPPPGGQTRREPAPRASTARR